jgi:putative holliday junction resolvase
MIYNDYSEFKNFLIYEKRILGIDIGEVKIGTALSDRSHLITNPNKIIKFNGQKQLLSEINSIIIEKEVCAIVIGKSNTQSKRICDLITYIDQNINLPITFVDESYSTALADNILKEYQLSRKKRNNLDDSIAANIILQDFLDIIRNI